MLCMDWITTGEASDMSGLTNDWIRKMCRKGIIECRRFGRDWMVSRSSLDDYLNTPRKTGPKPKDKMPQDITNTPSP